MNKVPIMDALRHSRVPLVRADYADDEAWARLLQSMRVAGALEQSCDVGDPEFEPFFVAVEDPDLDGLDPTALADSWDHGVDPGGYVLIADRMTFDADATGGRQTLLFLDPNESDEPESTFGETFRCVVDTVPIVVVNLDLANVDFFEFAEAAGEAGGVFSMPTDTSGD